MNVLLTGFAGAGEHINASGELIASLAEHLPDGFAHAKDRLRFELLSCHGATPSEEQIAVKSELNRVLSKHEPTLCIFTGQAPTCNRLRIERFATNLFLGARIDDSAPAAYASTLPGIERLPDLLNSHHLPARHSNYAGQHTCNHVLFSALHLARVQGLDCRSGLIHVPVLPQQVASATEFPFRDSPYMALEQTRSAMVHIVNHIMTETTENRCEDQ